MKVFDTKDLAQKHIKNLLTNHKSIGLVPTMGALHDGHMSLVKIAKANNDFVAVSIFVNPTQFNNTEDLDKYPRTLEEDLRMLKNIGCDFVFTPKITDIYKEKEEAEVFDFKGLDQEMEGKFRANHFNGVGTIVKKLFQILQPTNAYFGEKDFQQLQIIKKLVEITKQQTNIIGCKIFREKDGLAYSSRNTRLTNEHRASAPYIYQILSEAKEMAKSKKPSYISTWVENKFKNHPNLVLEYFTIAKEKDLRPVQAFDNKDNYRAFIAVFAGDVRLIDNLQL